MFYGWRVVAVCFVAAVFTWGFGTFGASVYLSAVTSTRGWSISLVSAGVTVYYLTNAALLTTVGSAIDRYGPRPVFIAGTLALAAGVVCMGQVTAPWQLYAAFALIGAGYASMALTGISATIAPWFERHQGRSVAMALTGASVGAMVVVPLLVLAIEQFGFAGATLGGGILTLAVLLPLAAIVLRHRGPQELGLGRDGDAVVPPAAGGAAAPPRWTRATAMRTPALWTASIGFALGLVVQVGFLTHHLMLAKPVLGATGAGWLVGATGAAGLVGRLLLARIADGIDVRLYSAAIFLLQAIVLVLIVLWPDAPVLIGASLVYGFCLGQITTLSPIVVRREFGADSYGAIYGIAATVTQLSSAFGPAIYGALRDLLGGYGPVLAIAAAFELAAMATVLVGRPRGAVAPAR